MGVSNFLRKIHTLEIKSEIEEKQNCKNPHFQKKSRNKKKNGKNTNFKKKFRNIFDFQTLIIASKTLKMVKNPIFSHLGPRYRFLTTRKLISGQNYYRSTQKLKKFDFFAKIFFSSTCQHWQNCSNFKMRFFKNGLSNIAQILYVIRSYIGLIAYDVLLEQA